MLSKIASILLNGVEEAKRNYETAEEVEYDDYGENHSPLATYFHHQLKDFERFNYTVLPYKASDVNDEFTSEYAAKKALRECLGKTYDAANSYVTIGSPKSVAKKYADQYADVVEGCFVPIMDSLRKLCISKEKPNTFTLISEYVDACRKELTDSFEEEIRDNQDYYRMYKFDYFVECVTIEEHDYRMGNGLYKVLESLVPGNVTYTFSNYFDTLAEMEKDINDRISSFCKFAYGCYLAYVRRIEKVIEALGNDYPEFTENENIADYIDRIAK